MFRPSMAKRKNRNRAALRLTPGTEQKTRSKLEKELDARAAAIKSAWAARHPERAAEERRLRKANIAARARWAHKRNGTPETHEHFSRKRQGALARLHMSGAIDAELLAAGAEIAAASALIMCDVAVRTASLETRIDNTPHGEVFHEALGRVWMEVAYSQWRADPRVHGPLLLSVVHEDLGIAAAAARHHMAARRARALVVTALQIWIDMFRQTRRDIDEEAVARAHAAIV
ncbi:MULTISPECIES: hypothetical protein [unclassified Sphingobium]|uniref:hypothetical protein n=1 Tax=unclassified Sphingobium TaxID=2611147 RepID=UPI002224F161|nr:MULTISPECIES: hypothetical protein [unclassified Sphingobium]MCW2412021.1 hypothetical protein [Sphingobium sp. B8D3D]MCW2415681.1 hypothetical protein [Sphingobium sp. B8D3A]